MLKCHCNSGIYFTAAHFGTADRVRHVECVPLEHAMHVRLVGALLKSSSIGFVVKLV